MLSSAVGNVLAGLTVIAASATGAARAGDPAIVEHESTAWARRESSLAWALLGSVLDANEPAGRANVVYSPWCVFRGLMLLADGATGRTADQFAAILPASRDAERTRYLWRLLDPARPRSPLALGIQLAGRRAGEVDVVAVRKDSPSARAQIAPQQGDRIVCVNGQRVESEDGVYRSLALPGPEARLVVKRPGESSHRTIRVPWPDLVGSGLGFAEGPGSAGDADVPIVLWGSSLWLDRSSEFLPTFLESGRTTHGAALERVDFRGEPGLAAKALDRWVSLQTRGKITRAVPVGGITAQTRLVNVNTIFIHAQWDTPFESTAPGPFRSRGKRTSVLKMFSTTRMPFYKDESFEAVELLYRHSSLSMVILLPRKGHELRTLAKHLSTRSSRLDRRMATHELIELRLSRFRVGGNLELSDALKSNGLDRAFSAEAKFSRLSSGRDPLRLDSAWNQAQVAVDEKGTEAVGVAAIAAVPLSGSPQPKRIFDVDRPFLFVIRDQATEMTFFAGAVDSINVR